VWIGVGPGEVAQRVFRGRPFLGSHTRILAAQRCAILDGVCSLSALSLSRHTTMSRRKYR
jgi:hypothetical protein